MKRNPKDLLDISVEYSNAAINRFHEGKVGSGLGNAFMGITKLTEWSDGLLRHFQSSRWSHEDRDAAMDQLHVGEIPFKIRNSVNSTIKDKYKFANRRYITALNLWWNISNNVQNAAGRKGQAAYRAFDNAVGIVYSAGNAAKAADKRQAVIKAALAADAWLAGPSKEAEFARKQIEKFQANITVQTKYGDEVCDKCGGVGFISSYAHIDGGVCYDCGGTGAKL